MELMGKDNDNQSEKSGFIEVNPNRGYTRVYISARKIMLNNFIGGLAWGLGTIIGATIVITLVLILFTNLGGLPIIGDFFNNLAIQIQPTPTISE